MLLLFFSRNGFTKPATEYADTHRIALFRLETSGTALPCNQMARSLGVPVSDRPEEVEQMLTWMRVAAVVLGVLSVVVAVPTYAVVSGQETNDTIWNTIFGLALLAGAGAGALEYFRRQLGIQAELDQVKRRTVVEAPISSPPATKTSRPQAIAPSGVAPVARTAAPVVPTGVGGMLTVIPIERDVSQSADASRFAGWLYANLMADRADLRDNRASVEFVWEGYEADPRELWDIPEVVEFVRDLNERWPCSLYFLSRSGSALQVMMFCLVGASAVSRPTRGRGVSEVNTVALGELLRDVWFPALNRVADLADLSDAEAAELTSSATEYLNRNGH